MADNYHTNDETEEYRKSDEFQYERLRAINTYVERFIKSAERNHSLKDSTSTERSFDDGFLLGGISSCEYVLALLRPALRNLTGYQRWINDRETKTEK